MILFNSIILGIIIFLMIVNFALINTHYQSFSSEIKDVLVKGLRAGTLYKVIMFFIFVGLIWMFYNKFDSTEDALTQVYYVFETVGTFMLVILVFHSQKLKNKYNTRISEKE